MCLSLWLVAVGVVVLGGCVTPLLVVVVIPDGGRIILEPVVACAACPLWLSCRGGRDWCLSSLRAVQLSLMQWGW